MKIKVGFPKINLYTFSAIALLILTSLQLTKLLKFVVRVYLTKTSIYKFGLKRIQIIIVPLNFCSTTFLLVHALVPLCAEISASPYSQFSYNMTLSFQSLCFIWYEYELISVFRSENRLEKISYLFIALSCVLILVPIVFLIYQLLDGSIIKNWEKVICKLNFSISLFFSIPCVIYCGQSVASKMAKVIRMRSYSKEVEKEVWKRHRKNVSYMFVNMMISCACCFLIAFEKIMSALSVSKDPYHISLCLRYLFESKWNMFKGVFLKVIQIVIVLWFARLGWIPLLKDGKKEERRGESENFTLRNSSYRHKSSTRLKRENSKLNISSSLGNRKSSFYLKNDSVHNNYNKNISGNYEERKKLALRRFSDNKSEKFGLSSSGSISVDGRGEMFRKSVSVNFSENLSKIGDRNDNLEKKASDDGEGKDQENEIEVRRSDNDIKLV